MDLIYWLRFALPAEAPSCSVFWGRWVWTKVLQSTELATYPRSCLRQVGLSCVLQSIEFSQMFREALWGKWVWVECSKAQNSRRFQDFKISKFQDFLIDIFCFKISRFQKFQDFLIDILCFKISRFQDFKISRFPYRHLLPQDSKISRLQDFKISFFEILKSWILKTPSFGTPSLQALQGSRFQDFKISFFEILN